MSRLEKQMVQRQELLPGIPDDITLDLITTKLPWSAVRKLALLSSGWQQAIQTREVYNARVRSNSTETLAFTEFQGRVPRRSEPCTKLCLYIYSSRDRVVHSLPSIPDYPEGTTIECQLASLDGKLYVLGGKIETADERTIISKKVYVLDLAIGQRQWKEVTSMQKPRSGYKAVVIHGKIYAFGGFIDPVHLDSKVRLLGLCDPGVYDPEVYDPEVNAWSIVPVYDPESIMSWTLNDNIEEFLAVDEGFCVFGARPYGRGMDDNQWLKIYHPGRNDWREVEHFRRYSDEVIFVAKGKLHSISKRNVNVYDIAKESWTILHSFSFEEENVDVCIVVALESELLAKVHWRDFKTHKMEEWFIQSRGFGSKSERIAWNKVCSTFDYRPFAALVPVQL